MDLGEKEAEAANTMQGQNTLPRPYYQDSAATIFHGNCIPILRELGAVDIVITDPPYSQHVHVNGMRGARNGNGDIRGESKDFGFESVSGDLMRSVFSDIETAPDWREAICGAGLEYIRTGAWVKIAPTPQFTGDRPAAGFASFTHAARKNGMAVARRRSGGIVRTEANETSDCIRLKNQSTC